MKAILSLAASAVLFLHANAQQLTVPQLNGPDGPDVTAASSPGTITLTLSNNNPTSNNFMEGYVETSIDLVQQGQPDTTFNFQGYLIYQLSQCVYAQPINWNFLQDTLNARLVGQSDYTDNIGTLINHESALACAADTMVVAANAGLQNTIVLTTDAFTGLPFQGGSDYAFTAVAYAHNAFYYQSACTPLLSPFLNGGKLKTGCVTMVGITEPSTRLRLEPSPNPATDRFSFSIPGNSGNSLVRVVDYTGRKVREFSAPDGSVQTIDVAGWPAGVYSISVTGKTFAAAKIVVD